MAGLRTGGGFHLLHKRTPDVHAGEGRLALTFAGRLTSLFRHALRTLFSAHLCCHMRDCRGVGSGPTDRKVVMCTMGKRRDRHAAEGNQPKHRRNDYSCPWFWSDKFAFRSRVEDEIIYLLAEPGVIGKCALFPTHRHVCNVDQLRLCVSCQYAAFCNMKTATTNQPEYRSPYTRNL